MKKWERIGLAMQIGREVPERGAMCNAYRLEKIGPVARALLRVNVARANGEMTEEQADAATKRLYKRAQPFLVGTSWAFRRYGDGGGLYPVLRCGDLEMSGLFWD